MAQFLNENVKHLRASKKMSQQTLADKIGVDRSTISRIENNEIETTIDNAIKIAEAFNVELSDLISLNLQSEDTIQKATFEKDGMKITIGKDGNITNDDFDDAMAFLLEQKIINKKDKENNNN